MREGDVLSAATDWIQLRVVRGEEEEGQYDGDVYGIYIAITGEGYTHREIYEYAKFLQRELLNATDVKRIDLYGVRSEVIYIEMRRDKMSKFGIAQQDIYDALAAKNLPVSAGYISLGPDYLAVHPTGEFQSEEEFGDLLVSTRGQILEERQVA